MYNVYICSSNFDSIFYNASLFFSNQGQNFMKIIVYFSWLPPFSLKGKAKYLKPKMTYLIVLLLSNKC